MARTDLLFDPDDINAVAADGSLNIATSPDVFTSPDKEPDIRLTPSRASLILGGNTSDGRAILATNDGEKPVRRINLSASGAGFSEQDVFGVGPQSGAGQLEMGRVGDREPTVAVNAERGHLRLNRIPEEEYPYDTGDWSPQGAISLDAKPAHIIVGSGAQIDTGAWIGKSGSIELRNSKDTDTVNIQAAGESGGGKIQLAKSGSSSTVTADGGTGTLMLGAAPPQGAPSLEHAQQMSENGEVWLDDGRGKKYGLKAENGTLGLGPSSDSSGQIGLVMKPEDGVFEIVDSNGNAVFRIDTKNKTIQTGRDYNQGDI